MIGAISCHRFSRGSSAAASMSIRSISRGMTWSLIALSVESVSPFREWAVALDFVFDPMVETWRPLPLD